MKLLICAIAYFLLPARVATGSAWLDLTAHLQDAERVTNPREIVLADPGSEKLLRLGWAVPEKWPGQSSGCVWADAPESVIEIPLAMPCRMLLTLRLAPLSCPGCHAQTARISLNGQSLAMLSFPQGGFADYTIEVPRAAWRYRDNAMAFRWGWLRSPRELDPASSDRRRLAAAVVSLRLQEIGPSRPASETLSAPKNGSISVPAGEALAFYLRLPGSAVLRGSVARIEKSGLAPSGIARISLRHDGAPEEDLLVSTLSGLSESDRAFRLDLSRFAGRVVRISLRTEGSADLAARFSDARIEIPDPPPWDAEEALGHYTPPPPKMNTMASGATRPSILLYVMDALRSTDLGCYGSLLATSPFLDRLSRRGVILTENTSQAPNTPPSIKALMTGRFLPFTGNGPLDPRIPTLAQAFTDAGYRTGAFVNTPWPAAVGALRGFAYVADQLFFKEGVTKEFARDITERLASWVSDAPAAPFFAYAHSIHPHNPYAPPAPWDRSLESLPGTIRGETQTLFQIQKGACDATANELAELHQIYCEDVLYNDHEIARLAAKLRSRGAWERTLLLLLSDHGDEIGEHGGMLHGWTAFAEMIHIPVILHHPGSAGAGALIAQPTETIDIAPTVAAMAGIPFVSTDGRPFPSLLAADWPAGRRVYSSASSVPGIYCVIDGSWKYVFAPRNGQEVGIGEGVSRVRERFYLYDQARDSKERRNVVHQYPILAEYLHRSIGSWLTATGAGSALQPSELPAEIKDVLKQLGYLGAD